MSYTYNPEKVSEPGVDRMRCELGDVMVEGGTETCALTDEEYKAVLKRFNLKTQWRKAKIEILRSILYRFAYEVDTKVGPLSLSLSERHKRWKELYDDLKSEDDKCAVPTANPQAIGSRPYFYKGMHDNRTSRYRGGGKIVP